MLSRKYQSFSCQMPANKISQKMNLHIMPGLDEDSSKNAKAGLETRLEKPLPFMSNCKCVSSFLRKKSSGFW